MRPHFSDRIQRHGSFLTVVLVAVFAASACAPAAATNPPPAAELPTATTAPAADAIPTATGEVAAPVVPTQAVAEVLPVATSRGPNLEATDPTTVNLAAGQLQLVEFFRFT
ncbi:MAG TPA: hypothetical protein PKE48_12945 [Anaerolineales bacterium]|nr:hypothetical protein [Anaerolineales bacterium]